MALAPSFPLWKHRKSTNSKLPHLECLQIKINFRTKWKKGTYLDWFKTLFCVFLVGSEVRRTQFVKVLPDLTAERSDTSTSFQTQRNFPVEGMTIKAQALACYELCLNYFSMLEIVLSSGLRAGSLSSNSQLHITLHTIRKHVCLYSVYFL
jgi:hypothetical protein